MFTFPCMRKEIVSTLELGIWIFIAIRPTEYAEISKNMRKYAHIRHHIFFPTEKSEWPSLINNHVISKLSLVFVPPDKATGSTLCVARGQLCRESSVGIQATEEMATTIGRRVHVTSE